MDREDRDHFKTIRNQSAEPLTGSQTKWQQEPSASRQDLDWFRAKARAIFGCYRRDEAQDPDAFAAALAVVLADYPTSVIEYAADPRTGVITAFPMGLPNVGQIRQFLEDTQIRQERFARYAALPKPKRSDVFDKPAPAEPNLFVPDTSPRYAALAKRAEQEPERARFGSNICKDGASRQGVFVPLNWWEEPNSIGDNRLAEAAQRFFEKACTDAGFSVDSLISPALAANLKESANVADA